MHNSTIKLKKGPSKVGLFLCLGIIVVFIIPVVLSANSEHYEPEIVMSRIPQNKKTWKYQQFQPSEIKDFQLAGIEIGNTYLLNKNKLIVGNKYPSDGESGEEFGERLFWLNERDEVEFTYNTSSDFYLYQPCFFKRQKSSKVIVVCQMGFEYYCGGDAYIIENGKINYIGYLNIEGDNPERPLVDELIIEEKEDRLTFSLRCDSLILDPGGETEHIVGNGAYYEYHKGGLVIRED